MACQGLLARLRNSTRRLERLAGWRTTKSFLGPAYPMLTDPSCNPAKRRHVAFVHCRQASAVHDEGDAIVYLSVTSRTPPVPLTHPCATWPCLLVTGLHWQSAVQSRTARKASPTSFAREFCRMSSVRECCRAEGRVENVCRTCGELALPSLIAVAQGRRNVSTDSGSSRLWRMAGDGSHSDQKRTCDSDDNHGGLSQVNNDDVERRESIWRNEDRSESVGLADDPHKVAAAQVDAVPNIGNANWQASRGSGKGQEEGERWESDKWNVMPDIDDAQKGEGIGDMVAAASGADLLPVTAPMVVEAMIGVLDGVHSLCGSPWWLTLAGTTVLLRLALAPLTILQIRKSAQIGVVMSTMVSQKGGAKGGGLMKLIESYNRLRRDENLPSLAWIGVMPLVQVPLFVTCMLAVRHMSIHHHTGFETGGALWFTDLSAVGSGPPSIIFPALVTATFLTNLQVSFSGVKNETKGAMGTFMKWYKRWLHALAIPTFVAGFYLPQGVFMYWLTTNSMSLAQALLLHTDSVRSFFQLPALPRAGGGPTYPTSTGNIKVLDWKAIKEMSGGKLVEIASQLRAADRSVEAIKILRLAVRKDPRNEVAYMGLAKMHASLKKWEEAAEFYGIVAAMEINDDVRGSAIFGAGVCLSMQGRNSEAISFLQECISIQPENGVALIALASMLSKEGQQEEALHVLRKAAELDPKVVEAYIRPLEAQIAAGLAPEINVAGIDHSTERDRL